MMKNFNQVALLSEVFRICWEHIVSKTNNANHSVCEWTNLFSLLIEKHALLSRIRVSQKCSQGVEIVQSAINFSNERINIEEDGTINNLKKVLESKSAKECIVSSRDLISQMFGDGALEEFFGDVSTSWSRIFEIKEIALEDSGSIYALEQRKMTQASQGIMEKYLASFLTLTPHSMATERAVSHYNNIKRVKRKSLKQEAINGVMHISLND